MKKIDNLFVSALYYGINKAIVDVIGTGGKVLGRRTSYEMIKFLKDMDVIHENMTDSEIEDLFVNKFGLSEKIIIENNDNEVIFHVINPTLDLFLEKIMEENIEPYVCPFIHLLSRIYEESRGYKLMLKQVIPKQEQASIIFKKMG